MLIPKLYFLKISEPDFEGLNDVYVEFNVFDGVFWAGQQVRYALTF